MREQPLLHRYAGPRHSHSLPCAQVEALQSLLKLGASVAHADKRGCTALHHAARSAVTDPAPCVLELLRAGAQVDARDERLRTPLVEACASGHAAAVRVLLEQRANVALADGSAVGCSHMAALHSHAACLALVLRHGATAHERDMLGRSPLFCALASGRVECVQLLLAAGAGDETYDLRLPLPPPATPREEGAGAGVGAGAGASAGPTVVGDAVGTMPRRVAAGPPPTGSASVRAPSPLPQPSTSRGRLPAAAWAALPYLPARCTALHVAAVAGNADAIPLLLSRVHLVPRQLAATDARGDTALVSAVRLGRGESLAALLQAGATTAAVSLPHGRTLLHLAAEAPPHLTGGAVVAQLVSLGVSLAAREHVRGQTALYLAAACNNEVCVREMLDRGASVHVRDDQGWTPLHGAARAGALRVVRMLVAAGARTDAADGVGRTPLHVANEHGQEAVIEFLLMRSGGTHGPGGSGGAGDGGGGAGGSGEGGSASRGGSFTQIGGGNDAHASGDESDRGGSMLPAPARLRPSAARAVAVRGRPPLPGGSGSLLSGDGEQALLLRTAASAQSLKR